MKRQIISYSSYVFEFFDEDVPILDWTRVSLAWIGAFDKAMFLEADRRRLDGQVPFRVLEIKDAVAIEFGHQTRADHGQLDRVPDLNGWMHGFDLGEVLRFNPKLFFTFSGMNWKLSNKPIPLSDLILNSSDCPKFPMSGMSLRKKMPESDFAGIRKSACSTKSWYFFSVSRSAPTLQAAPGP